MSDTGFDETPDVTSRLLHEFAAEGLVNIGGWLLRYDARSHWRHSKSCGPPCASGIALGAFYKEAA
jgi:5-methyltetrahydrofolate--homocysteine methyltransferase